MDYCELNQYIEVNTADVCASNLQEWHQKGSNMSLLDLKKACCEADKHVDPANELSLMHVSK